MDDTELRSKAAQLRKPEGEAGIETALQMNNSNELMNRAAVEALDAQPNDRILEIGMGNGKFISEYVARDPSISYTGCDYSETMIAEATRNNEAFVRTGQVRFIHAPADHIPCQESTFDKAVGVNTIYFWSPGAELHELHRVLKPGGKLILAMRPKDYMQYFPFVKYGFTLYFEQELCDLLTRNNFHVLSSSRSHEHNRETDDGTIVRVETVVVVARAEKR